LPDHLNFFQGQFFVLFIIEILLHVYFEHFLDIVVWQI